MAVMIPGLQIEVMHKEITVTLPGTSYTATYYKPKTFEYCLQSTNAEPTISGLR
jgi:hypothetical protein